MSTAELPHLIDEDPPSGPLTTAEPLQPRMTTQVGLPPTCRPSAIVTAAALMVPEPLLAYDSEPHDVVFDLRAALEAEQQHSAALSARVVAEQSARIDRERTIAMRDVSIRDCCTKMQQLSRELDINRGISAAALSRVAALTSELKRARSAWHEVQGIVDDVLDGGGSK
jgi:hypothetical protein